MGKEGQPLRAFLPRVEGWRVGRVEGWRVGGVEGWRDGLGPERDGRVRALRHQRAGGFMTDPIFISAGPEYLCSVFLNWMFL